MTSLYRIAMPFLGIMFFGLTIIMLVPWLSTVAVQGDIVRARAEAAAKGEPPRDAWMLECVQLDRNNPLPCTDEDKKKWGAGEDVARKGPDPGASLSPATHQSAPDEDDFAAGSKEEEAFMKELIGDEAASGSAAPAAIAPP